MAKKEAVTQKIKVQRLYPNELDYIFRIKVIKIDVALRRIHRKIIISITKVLYLLGHQQQQMYKRPLQTQIALSLNSIQLQKEYHL